MASKGPFQPQPFCDCILASHGCSGLDLDKQVSYVACLKASTKLLHVNYWEACNKS